jgi:hypothetical protein
MARFGIDPSATAPAKTHVKKHKKAVTPDTNSKPAATTPTPPAAK